MKGSECRQIREVFQGFDLLLNFYLGIILCLFVFFFQTLFLLQIINFADPGKFKNLVFNYDIFLEVLQFDAAKI